MQEDVFQAALAGLLHDIGKFLGRASPTGQEAGIPDSKKGIGYRHAEAGQKFIQAYVPAKFKLISEVVQFHHQPERLSGQSKLAYNLARLVRLADQLAAGGTEGQDAAGTPEAALVPILAQVELLEPASSGQWRYQPRVLTLDRANIFPDEAKPITVEAYQTLWLDYFQPELTRWKEGKEWAQQSPETYFTTLLALLQRHLSLVPAGSPWLQDEDDAVAPDVSLFSHLKVTAAIAACLAANFDPAEIKPVELAQDRPLVRLVRGDISGIQSFIYRITQPETDAGFDHVAKRLRGRSFYLSLLGEVLAHWLMRQLELPAANILFIGGGQFDLLIPLNKQTELQECVKTLEAWLLKEFYGELGLQIASVELKAADFRDMRPAYRELSRLLEVEKSRKWVNYLHTPDFFISTEKLYHRCRVCHLTQSDESDICDLCRNHDKIGQRLPQTTHLAFVEDELRGQWPAGCVTVPFKPFGVTVGLLERDEVETFIQMVRSPARLSLLNPENEFIRPALPQVAQSFSFLANAAPIATTSLWESLIQRINRGDVLHFDAIAELSRGAKRIGILKADVDRLGLLFSEGLAAESGTSRPTLSRAMALSHTLDLFFAGWLNHVCAEVFQEWQNRQQQEPEAKRHSWSNRVDGLFYIMYSGGDDLFIVGPWDETLKLARRLQQDFAAYACHNPNLTLSAGVVQVKPRYPVQRFAALVDEAENGAKQAGRARITVFDHTVLWDSVDGNFIELMALGERLRDLLEANEMPRTLLHDLGRLYRMHHQRGGKKLKPMWTPRLFYTMARRLSQETLQAIGYDLVDAMSKHTILVPISYASLITRKE